MVVLYAHSFAEGVKVTYPGLSVGNDTTNVPNNAPYERIMTPSEQIAGFRVEFDKYSQNKGLAMTRQEREVTLKFGRRLLQSNPWEQEFWASSANTQRMDQ